jgi:hypothetical protein
MSKLLFCEHAKAAFHKENTSVYFMDAIKLLTIYFIHLLWLIQIYEMNGKSFGHTVP